MGTMPPSRRRSRCGSAGAPASCGKPPRHDAEGRNDGRPDQRHGDEGVHQRRGEFVGVSRQKHRRRAKRARNDRRGSRPARKHKDGQTDQHAGHRQAEAVLPAVGFSDVAAQERRNGGAEIDAHVEEREPRVALAWILAVECADDRGDVRLEETVADDQQAQSAEKGERLGAHQEALAEGHQHRPEDHRPPRRAIGRPAFRQKKASYRPRPCRRRTRCRRWRRRSAENDALTM